MKKIIFFVLIVFIIMVVFFYFKNSNSFIVYVESENENYISNGSGVVYKKLNNKHYIVTNYHIVANSVRIYVYNSKGKKTTAKLEYYDDYTDIAILSTEKNNLIKAKLNKCDYNTDDKIKIIGYNFNKGGYILSLKKHIDVPNIYGNSVYDAMELKYNIDYGDSGSAVIDKYGNVIGLLSVMDSQTKMGYAIPICDVMSIVNLLENGKLSRPNLQAKFTNSNSDIKGALILRIYDNSILNDLELKEYDIITRINDIDIKSISDFRNELYQCKVGDKISLKYYRNDSYYEVTGIIK